MRYGWLLFALVRCPLCLRLCHWLSAAGSSRCSCVAGGWHLYCSSLLQGLIIVAVVASLPLLTLSEAGDAFQATPSNAGASQRRRLPMLAPSDVVFVVVVVPGSGAGLSAGAKPWRRMP